MQKNRIPLTEALFLFIFILALLHIIYEYKNFSYKVFTLSISIADDACTHINDFYFHKNYFCKCKELNKTKFFCECEINLNLNQTADFNSKFSVKNRILFLNSSEDTTLH